MNCLKSRVIDRSAADLMPGALERKWRKEAWMKCRAPEGFKFTRNLVHIRAVWICGCTGCSSCAVTVRSSATHTDRLSFSAVLRNTVQDWETRLVISAKTRMESDTSGLCSCHGECPRSDCGWRVPHAMVPWCHLVSVQQHCFVAENTHS